VRELVCKKQRAVDGRAPPLLKHTPAAIRLLHVVANPRPPLHTHTPRNNTKQQATAKHPRKSMYRARAHSNPFNDPIYDVPAHPNDFDWCAGGAWGGWRVRVVMKVVLRCKLGRCSSRRNLPPPPHPSIKTKGARTFPTA
jgi:hypothetical protein